MGKGNNKREGEEDTRDEVGGKTNGGGIRRDDKRRERV